MIGLFLFLFVAFLFLFDNALCEFLSDDELNSRNLTCVHTIANITYCADNAPTNRNQNSKTPYLYLHAGFTPLTADDDDEEFNDGSSLPFSLPKEVSPLANRGFTLNKTLFRESVWKIIFTPSSRVPPRITTPKKLYLFASIYEHYPLQFIVEDKNATDAREIGKQYAELHFENATARKQKIFEFDLNDLNVHSVTFQTTDFDWGLTEEQENRSISNQQYLYVTGIVDRRGGEFNFRIGQEFDSDGWTAILIGFLFLMIAGICFPCILAYSLWGCVACCCKSRANSDGFGGFIMSFLGKKGAHDDDTPGCCNFLKLANRSVGCAVLSATIGSIVMTILSLFAVVFNITLIAQGLQFVDELLPTIATLHLNLLEEYGVDISGLFDSFNSLTTYLISWKYGFMGSCAGGQVLLSTALLAFLGWYTFLTVYFDLYVKVKLFVAGSNGPLFEMLGNTVSRILLYLLQASLQQLYIITIALLFEGELAEGCTPLDDSFRELRNFRSFLWFIITIAILVLFTRPWGEEHKEFKGFWGLFGSVLYGLLINIAITLGVWTQDVVDWTDLEERADHADDLEDGEALVTTIDTIGRVSGLMWMMLPPFFVVGTKIAEATNESTLIVTAKSVRAELDPWFIRAPVVIFNLIALALELYAAVTASAKAVVWAGVCVLIRDMVVKLATKIWHLLRKRRRRGSSSSSIFSRKKTSRGNNSSKNKASGARSKAAPAQADVEMTSARASKVETATVRAEPAAVVVEASNTTTNDAVKGDDVAVTDDKQDDEAKADVVVDVEQEAVADTSDNNDDNDDDTKQDLVQDVDVNIESNDENESSSSSKSL